MDHQKEVQAFLNNHENFYVHIFPEDDSDLRSMAKKSSDNATIKMAYMKLLDCDIHLKEADVHYNSFHPNKAIEHAQIALDIANKWDFSNRKVEAYKFLGVNHELLGCVKDVIRYYNEMIYWSQQSGDKFNEGTAYQYLTNFHLHRSLNFEEAARCAEKRLELANETGIPQDKASAYVAIGMVLAQQGQFDKAEQYYQKSLDIARHLKDNKLEYIANFNLGNLANLLGRNYDALRYFSQSIHLSMQMSGVDHENDLGSALLHLGDVYRKIGDFEEAIKKIEKAIELSITTNNLPSQSIGCMNLAKIYEYTGDQSRAIEYTLLGIIIAVRIGDKRGKMYYYQLLGNWFLDQNLNDKAIQCQKRSLKIALESKEYSSIVCAYSNLTRVYEVLEMLTDQIKLSEDLLKTATKHGDKNFQAQCFENMAKAFGKAALQYQPDHDKFTQYMKEAEEYQRKCVHHWDELFYDLRDREHCKLSISDRYLSSRVTLSSILISTGQVLEALMVAETGRACILKDTLKLKYKMDNQPTKSQLQGPEKLTESEVIDLVPNHSRIVFYCFNFDSSHTLFWVLSKTDQLFIHFTRKKVYQDETISLQNHFAYIYALVIKLHQTIVSAGRESIANCENRSLGRSRSVIDEYSSQTLQRPQESTYILDGFQFIKKASADNLRNPGTLSPPLDVSKNLKQPLKELYNEFIAPVQEHLTHDETVIVPEGILHYVPFAALQDPKTDRYLCESTCIRLVPSLVILKHLNDCPTDFHSDKGALVIGNPSVGEVMFRGERKTFPNLPAAETEARVFSSILGVSPLTGMAATKDAVREKLKEDASVIHIAAHGDDSTGEIVLAPSISAQSKSIPEEEDYILAMDEVQEIGVRAKLVVLSCCHSGCGEIRAEGVIGMARAFLAAGARAVVASLWAISDQATLDFMSSFYTSLRLGKSASVSLNEAMNDQIQSSKYNKPKYWAPFFLIGDDVTIWP